MNASEEHFDPPDFEPANVPADQAITQCIVYTIVLTLVALGLKQYVFPKLLPSLLAAGARDKDQENVAGRIPLFVSHILGVCFAVWGLMHLSERWLARSVYMAFATEAADIVHVAAFNTSLTGYMGASMWLHRILMCSVILITFIFQLEISYSASCCLWLNLSSLGEVWVAGILPHLKLYFWSIAPIFATIQFVGFLLIRAMFMVALVMLYKPGLTNPGILVAWLIAIIFLGLNHFLVAQSRWPLLSQGRKSMSFNEVSSSLFSKTGELAVVIPYLDDILTKYVFPPKGSKRMREARRRVQVRRK